MKRTATDYWPQALIDAEINRLRDEGKKVEANRISRMTSREQYLEKQDTRRKAVAEAQRKKRMAKRKEDKALKQKRAQMWQEMFDEADRKGIILPEYLRRVRSGQ